MIDTIMAFWDGFLKVVQTAPIQLWAIVLGNLISWGLSLRIKTMLPKKIKVFKFMVNRKWFVDILGFLIAFVVIWLLWPGKIGIIVAIAVGLWSPFSFRLFLAALEKKFPKTREALSPEPEEPEHECPIDDPKI